MGKVFIILLPNQDETTETSMGVTQANKVHKKAPTSRIYSDGKKGYIFCISFNNF